MDISGVTVIKNGVRLGYPFVESILSLIPLCDEIVVSEGYSDDDTYHWLERLRDRYPDKIRLFRERWPEGLPGGRAIGEMQTRALRHCRGRWIYLLQGDEFMPEESAAYLRELCNPSLLVRRVIDARRSAGEPADSGQSAGQQDSDNGEGAGQNGDADGQAVSGEAGSSGDAAGPSGGSISAAGQAAIAGQSREQRLRAKRHTVDLALLRAQEVWTGAAVFNAYQVDFIHVYDHFQQFMFDMNYRWATRLVRNRPGTYSGSDGWLLQGPGCFPIGVARLPRPIIHLGYEFPVNIWRKNINQASLYPDVQKAQDYAREAERNLREYENGTIPPLPKGNPLNLPPLIAPLIGMYEYRVREELFR